MKQAKALKALALGAALLTNGAAAAAQDKKERKVARDVVVQEDVLITAPAEGGPHHPAPPAAVGFGTEGDNFVFVSAEMSFDGKVVKNAPYSAQAVTETTHTLSDGNRIVRRNTANVYRDSEGRTRRDQTIGAIGPFAAQGDPPTTFFIHDPVAGVNYILDPRTKTARKLPALPMTFERVPAPPGAKAAVGASASAARVEHHAKKMGQHVTRARTPGYVFSTTAPAPGVAVAAPEVMIYTNEGNEPKVEQLGRQTVEGVEADGQRVTVTIPAGAIGNERAIEIVSERWHSPELQTVVMTRHSDPRFGETVYRLTGISRSEPARSLFEVPSDYAVREPRGNSFRIFNKKLEGPPPPPEN